MDDIFIKEHYSQLLELLNCVNVGIFLTDGMGKTLLVNDVSCNAGGLPREKIMGKTVFDLTKSGYIKESVTAKVLNSKREEEMIQPLGDGGRVYVTGVPYKCKNEVKLVVTTERDITETKRLEELLITKTEQYENELEYLKKRNIIEWGELIAEDDISKQLVAYALKIAKLDTTVLLTGESGTGKEVYANFLYQNSARVGKPFIKINCAAIPENLIESELFGYEGGTFTGANRSGKMGIFEMANNGTLFLDEIGEIPIHLQSKLLRVLQEKEIIRVGGGKTIPLNIRIIAATNKNLRAEIEKGRFREDLYYRLNVMPLEIPPLRGRKKDIKKLTEYFINHFNVMYKTHKHINDEAMILLQNASWHGNIRELENMIERLIISTDDEAITAQQIKDILHIGKSGVINIEERPLKQMMEEYEKSILISMMEKYKTASKVSKAIEVDKATLHRRLKKYNII